MGIFSQTTQSNVSVMNAGINKGSLTNFFYGEQGRLSGAGMFNDDGSYISMTNFFGAGGELCGVSTGSYTAAQFRPMK